MLVQLREGRVTAHDDTCLAEGQEGKGEEKGGNVGKEKEE